jgi:hypothetical protein
VENHVCLSRGVGGKCDMTSSDEDHGRSMRPGAEDRGWSSIGQVLSDRTIRRLGDDVCGLYCAQGNEECEFLCLATKPRFTICQRFGLKITRSDFPVSVSKPLATV